MIGQYGYYVPCPTKNNRNLHILSESKGKEFAPRDADCTTSGWGVLFFFKSFIIVTSVPQTTRDHMARYADHDHFVTCCI